MDQNQSDAKLNLGDSSSDSQATRSNGNATTQVDEKSTVFKDSGSDVPFHEHPRFKELVEEKNHYKMEQEMLRKEVEALKRQNAGNMEASQQKSVFDKAVDDLVDQGMDRSAAARFVQQQVGLMQTVAQQNVAPLYQSQQQLTLSQTIDQFQNKYPDYDKYKTKMSEILASMSQTDKDWIMTNLSRGLKSLYDEAREFDLDNRDKENINKGREEAYSKKKEKTSVSSSHSSSPSIESLTEELQNTKVYDLETKKKWDRIEMERLSTK